MNPELIPLAAGGLAPSEISTGIWLLLPVLLVLGLLIYIALRLPRGGAADSAPRLAALESENALRVERIAQLEREREQQAEQLVRERAEQRALLDEARERRAEAERALAEAQRDLRHFEERAHERAELLTAEFRKLSAELLDKHGATFKEQNREQVEGLLKPLREKITDFEKNLGDKHTQVAELHASLKQQIEGLGTLSRSMLDEANNLTRALKGQTQTQGAWGEMILSRILELSGLQEGREFETQQSQMGAEGQRLRPDVLVNLPDGERVVIDSKVSLVAFEALVNSESEEQRVAAQAALRLSMRNHIKELSEKDYSAAVGSRLDYVILFVPVEGALAAALSVDPELTAYAIDRRVAIATPTTLMALLRTVASMWRIARQHQNAEEIARQAGALYDKFVGFVENLEKVSKAIDNARSTFDTARNQLASGKGNLVRRVELLRELGARTGKTLPAGYLDEDLAGADASPEAPDGNDPA